MIGSNRKTVVSIIAAAAAGVVAIDCVVAQEVRSAGPEKQRVEINTGELSGSAINATTYGTAIKNAALAESIKGDRAELLRLSTAVDAKLAELSVKTAALKEWLGRREAFLANVQQSLVRIYEKMPAEAAAVRLAELDEMVAAALLLRLDARQSGAIVGEMDTAKAARLSAIIASAVDLGVKGQPKDGSDKATALDDKKR